MKTLFTLVLLIAGLSTSYAQPKVVTLEEWIGKTQVEVIEVYKGKPLLEDEYPASKVAGELRNAVTKTYPADAPGSAGVTIRELWWKEGDYRLTFLLHLQEGKWVVLDAIRWHKDIVF